MSKYKYTESEKEINKALLHQSRQLNEISYLDRAGIEERIEASEKILKELGYDLPSATNTAVSKSVKEIAIPSWEEIVKRVNFEIEEDVILEDLFTEEELRDNSNAIRQLSLEYSQIHKLDKEDVGIAVAAGILGGIVDTLLIGVPARTKEGLRAKPLSDYIRKYFEKRFPPGELENCSASKVPYDAQDNRNTSVYVEGLSAYYHRLLSLGHDPLLGFVVGVFDIMRGSMTTIDKSGKIAVQVIGSYDDRKEEKLFEAIAKQVVHFKSDVTTSMGLPVPLMGLFNTLQFGKLGTEDQTIAEIVQGMYYEGYDFIHFCSMSIPAMIAEAVTRLGYSMKRISEGFPLKQSIPFSTNHMNNPKLGTMLFLGHSICTAINTGKLYFTKNPTAINYPEWIAFLKYSYQQLKWTLVTKANQRDKYISDILLDDLTSLNAEIDEMIESVSERVVIN